MEISDYVKLTNKIDKLIDENYKLKDRLDTYKQENKILKENAENNDKVVDKVNWENREFRKENHELRKRNYLLSDNLITYKQECIFLNKKLYVEKRKFYRNRKLFEEFIDLVLLTIDEDLLKQSVKEEILKKYDEDIKHN